MIRRSIRVRVSPMGETTVEAFGFKGKGCEAATKAIEEALGRKSVRHHKPDFWIQSQRQDHTQQLGGGDGSSNP